MSTTAMLIAWYQAIEKQTAGPRPLVLNADIAGGDV
jgi:hypothetical protein